MGYRSESAGEGWWCRFGVRSLLGAVVVVSVGAGVLAAVPGAAREAEASVPRIVSGAAAGGGLVLAQAGGFGDVADGAYYSAAVEALAAAGVFVGTECGPGLLCPDDPIDRKTMAVWAVRVVTGEDPPAVSESRFVDVDAGSFYGPFVERMAELEITLGCGDGTRFCPEQDTTRAQMAVFLSRAFSLADGPDPNFSDVSDGAWYGTDVARLAHSGITKGCGDGTGFCPEQDTTRAQMATFLHRALTRADRSSSGDGTVDPAEPDEPSDYLEGPQVGDEATPIDGQWTIPTFICAAEGKYTTGDLNSLVDQLNDELDGFFGRLSSQRMTLTFTVGSVLTDDIAWDTTSLSDLRNESIMPCRAEATRQPGTSHILILVDLHGGYISGYASYSGVAVVPTAAKTGGTVHLITVVHELAHSVLKLGHLKNKSRGGGVIFTNGVAAQYSGGISIFIKEPKLACYQYEQLGWPVPDYAQPCERLPPSGPELVTGGIGYIVTWEPPRFTDDAPITGYTVHIEMGDRISYASDGSRWIVANASTSYRRYEKDADARSHSFDLSSLDLSSLEPGTYLIAVSANTKYGEGDLNADTMQLVPVPPSFGPIQIRRITNTTIELRWNTESHEYYGQETASSIVYEVQYSANGVTFTEEVYGGDLNFARLRDLHEGTEYTIQVRACPAYARIENCTGWETLTASTLSVLPPPDPVSVASGDDWYLLTWEPVPGAQSYTVSYTVGFDNQYVIRHAPDYGASYGVQPDSTYTVNIRSCSSVTLPCLEGGQTTVTFSTAASSTVPPPYRIAILDMDDSWATLVWDILGPFGQNRLEYEYTDGDTNSGLLNHQYSRAISGPLRLAVDPNKTYSLKMRNCVIATDVDECSSWVSFRFTNPPVRSDLDPPSLQTTDVGNVWLTVSWDRIPGTPSYLLRYQRPDQDYFCCQYRETEPNRTLYGLEPGTTYTVQVRSCGDPTQPCSQWSTATFTTASSLPPLPQPYPVSARDVTDTQIQLTWSPAQPDDSYEFISYPTNERGGAYPTATGEGLSHDWTIPGLEPNTTYTIAIRTCSQRSGDDCTDWVATQVTTLPRR